MILKNKLKVFHTIYSLTKLVAIWILVIFPIQAQSDLPANDPGVLQEGEAPMSYTVEEGDTLYDICDQLIDNSDYWPKLWSLNPDIKNPHFIEAGTKLRFYPNDRFWAPDSKVVNSEDVVPVDNALINEASIVPEKSVENLLVNNSSASGADFVNMNDIPANNKQTYDTFGYVHDPSKYTLVLPAFFYDDYPSEIVGKVLVGTENESLGVPSSKFLIVPTGPDKIKLDTTYTVVRPRSDVTSLDSHGPVGIRYDFIGHLHVTKSVEQPKRILFEADIGYSQLGIRADDLVIPYRSTFKNYNVENKIQIINDNSASVFNLEIYDQLLGQLGEAVFIDKKLELDGYYPIYQELYLTGDMSFSKKKAQIKKMVAIMKVVCTYPKYSVGVIVLSHAAVKVGDTLGKNLVSKN